MKIGVSEKGLAFRWYRPNGKKPENEGVTPIGSIEEDVICLTMHVLFLLVIFTNISPWVIRDHGNLFTGYALLSER